VCKSLGLLVTSALSSNTLAVWHLPPECLDSADTWLQNPGPDQGLRTLKLLCTLGGETSRPPMRFFFNCGADGPSGMLAFTSPTDDHPPLLLVTDCGHDAVHVLDVASGVHVGSQSHVGFLAAPKSIRGPKGVAVCPNTNMVAVSAWNTNNTHAVVLYRGSGPVWEQVWAVEGVHGLRNCNRPYGLRFTKDGSAVCVTASSTNNICFLRARDGKFDGHLAHGLQVPRDVELVQGGWAVACVNSHSVEFIMNGPGFEPERTSLSLGRPGGLAGRKDGEFEKPSALAAIPGFGLVVFEAGRKGRLQFFVHAHVMAMRAMSRIRVAWMVAVCRGATGGGT
jgi:hypothetical protein